MKGGNKGTFSLANLQILLLASFPYQSLPLRSQACLSVTLARVMTRADRKLQDRRVMTKWQFLKKELNKAVILGLG